MNRTFDGVEEISAELRENIQSRDIQAVLADRLDGKSLLFQLLPGIWSRWATHDIYFVPKCCLFQYVFSPAGRRVDYD